MLAHVYRGTSRRLRVAAGCAGNLLAPWAAATATGVLRSAYSRMQLPRLRKRRMELLGKLKVCVRLLWRGSLPALAHHCTAQHAGRQTAHAVCCCAGQGIEVDC